MKYPRNLIRRHVVGMQQRLHQRFGEAIKWTTRRNKANRRIAWRLRPDGRPAIAVTSRGPKLYPVATPCHSVTTRPTRRTRDYRPTLGHLRRDARETEDIPYSGLCSLSSWHQIPIPTKYSLWHEIRCIHSDCLCIGPRLFRTAGIPVPCDGANFSPMRFISRIGIGRPEYL